MSGLGLGLASAPPQTGSRHLHVRRLLIYGMPLLVGLMVVSPLALLIANSFNVAAPGRPASYGLQNWIEAFSDPVTLSALWNSFSLALVRTAIGMPVAIALTWLVTRTDMPGRSLVEVLAWLSIFTPILPLTFGWILLLDPHFGLINVLAARFLHHGLFHIYGFWGIVWVYLATHAIAYPVVLLTPAFRRLGSAVEDAARVCGANLWSTLRFITLPVLAPAVFLTTLIALVFSFQGFEVELLLGVPVNFYVYSTRIYDLVSNQPSNVGEATVLAFVFLVWLLGLTLLYRWLLRGRSFTTVTGQGYANRPVALGAWRWVASTCSLGFFAVALGVPLAFLVLGSFMRLFGFFNVAHPFTLAHWQQVFADPAFLTGVRNSLEMASASAVVVVLLFSAVAYVIVRHRSNLALRAADLLVWSPWAAPGILMSLGFLWVFLATPLRSVLYGSVLGIVVAFVVRGSPLSTQFFKASLMQVGTDLEEAARVCGSTWLRAYGQVLMRLLAPTAVMVGLLTFLTSIYDIATPVLLYTSRSRPLAILMLEYAFSGETERAAAIGVLITAFVMLVLVAARRLGFRLSRERL